MTFTASAASAVTVFAVLAVAIAGGCINEVAIGSDATAGSAAGGDRAGTPNGGGAGAGSGGSGGDAAGTGGSTCEISKCGTKEYKCGNCYDDDLDGLTDADDSQCFGPCDDSEDSYYPAIPGQDGGSCRLDCYFDPGSGTNDQCYSSFRCDPVSVAPSYPPSGDPQCAYDPSANIPGTNASCADLSEVQSESCLATCGPLVPNGCDCFGCCELPAGSERFVWIGSTSDGIGTCTEETVDDPSACHPCTQVPSCTNACDDCEICAGRTTPAEACSSGEQCPQGRDACGLPGQPGCPDGQYCITGCCAIEPR